MIDAGTGRNNLYQVSSPGFVDGLINIRSTLHLEGGEANFLFNSGYFGPQLNLLAGFRYLEMGERLRSLAVLRRFRFHGCVVRRIPHA